MKPSEAIKRYTTDEGEKEILLWLISKYHYRSQWEFVAKSRWIDGCLVYTPTTEGVILYNNRNLLEEESK